MQTPHYESVASDDAENEHLDELVLASVHEVPERTAEQESDHKFWQLISEGYFD